MVNSHKIKIFDFWVVLSLIAAIFFINFNGINAADAAKVKKAPDFDLKVLNSAASGYADFSLESFRGHVVIINFWATWCPPCRHEISMLENFYQSERGNGVIVVGINVDNSLSGVRSFIGLHNIKYPVVYASSGLISNYGGINEIPQTFFISKNGNIMFHWVGEISHETLNAITGKLLNMN